MNDVGHTGFVASGADSSCQRQYPDFLYRATPMFLPISHGNDVGSSFVGESRDSISAQKKC